MTSPSRPFAPLGDQASADPPAGESGKAVRPDAVSPDAVREDDARQRLLTAAGPVFAEHGFDRATVREICRLAGVNVALVGYYFGDKFGLYREVIRTIRGRCRPQLIEPLDQSLTPRDRLHFHVTMMLTQMLSGHEAGWEAQLMMREMNHPTSVFAEMVDESFRPHFDQLKSILYDLSGKTATVDLQEKLALSIVGQCLYYRIGREVVKHLIPEPRLTESFDAVSLARHITGVIIAAAEGGLSSEHAHSLLPVHIPDFLRKTDL